MKKRANRLRRERKAAGLTQADLALLAKVPQATISRLERHATLRPSFDVLDKLATVLRRYGRNVEPAMIQPRPQPTLIKGLYNDGKRRVPA